MKSPKGKIFSATTKSRGRPSLRATSRLETNRTKRNGSADVATRKRKGNLKPVSKTPKYKPMPDLPPDEYEALKRDIAENGLRQPIDEDEDGNILDGHQRKRALVELGIKKYPIHVIYGLTDDQKMQHAISVNLLRRHLSTKQKQDLIKQQLCRNPKLNNNLLAKMLGVARKTVERARKRLESTKTIPKLTEFEGKDKKTRPAKYNRVIANTEKELAKAREVIQFLPPSCNGKVLDATTAARRANRHARQQARQISNESVEPVQGKDIRLWHCRFQDMMAVAGIESASAHLVLTDFPYGKDFLQQLHELAAFAEQVLMLGGLLVTYSGQYYLDQVMAAFGERLKWRWAMASVWDGDANLIHPLGITSQWKPILIYSKGDWKAHGRIPDVSHVESKEKDSHDWQQPLHEMEQLISFFSKPGDLVVDPCGGSFTTALACRNLGRRFIGCDEAEDCVNKGWMRLKK